MSHTCLDDFPPIPKPSLRLYLAVVLETLLLGYKTLADTSLTLMHCVPVELEWRLFIDGNIQCWQWWQYLQIVFILAFIIPLVLVLFWGSLMLSEDKVSAKEFLTSCAFPLPLLFIWLFRCCKRKEAASQYEYLPDNSKDTDDIKRILYDPFRSASDGDHCTLYWESVLVGRRFLLLTISTFISDPLTKFVCLGIACVLILAHHLVMKPFRDRKANICESLSLVGLTAICTFNLAKVTIIARGLEPAGPEKNLFPCSEVDRSCLAWLPPSHGLHPCGSCGFISSRSPAVPLREAFAPINRDHCVAEDADDGLKDALMSWCYFFFFLLFQCCQFGDIKLHVEFD